MTKVKEDLDRAQQFIDGLIDIAHELPDPYQIKSLKNVKQLLDMLEPKKEAK